MDLSLGERERLYANIYAPHPRTVKVQSLSLFSPGANKPSSLVSLVDILIVTSSLGVRALSALFCLPIQRGLIIVIMYQQHDYDQKST